MGREVKRVPVDFDHPLRETWPGFLMPDELANETPCPRDCDGGFSPRARELRNDWYGYRPFDPTSTGSTPITPEHRMIRYRAERNVEQAPEYYGTGEFAILREAVRLAPLFNSWSHHLAQEDVDVLVESGRLHDLTHTWTREDGWQPKDPPVHATAEQVNEWSLFGMGHDSINCMIVIEAKCEREGVPYRCEVCDGNGSLEAYPGQREQAEEWRPTEPPTGEGWQLWETISEGSPISPVFANSEGLVQWLCSPEYTYGISTPMQPEAARRFVDVGWAFTMMSSPETGLISGEEFVGRER